MKQINENMNSKIKDTIQKTIQWKKTEKQEKKEPFFECNVQIHN